MAKVPRVECIEVNYHPALSKLCHQVKNLYNRANFLIKQALNKKRNKELVDYYTLNSLLKKEECYKLLPAHTAQHTLKLLCRNWKAFFRAKNKWKQQVNLGKKTTQLFVSIPFHKIIHQLRYKAEERGITVSLIPENHTSKCSFLDNEFPKHRATYAGKRSTRGLFISAQGHVINADVNAAYNILVKSDPQALPKRKVHGVGGYVMYPRSVCVDPPGMTCTTATKAA